jgi:broad specificity phosphatase PhoE
VNKLASIISCLVIFLAMSPQSYAADLDGLVSSLKGGGYVLVFRHGATDDSQKDVYPFKLDDMTAQRQLSEKGRVMARELGEALKKLGVPIGDVYTSQLNRAVETGRLLGGKDVSPVDALTDSGAGSSSAMANPDGKNARTGRAVREIVNAPPKPGLNNLAVTHKTNVADAFGKEFADIREGEALVYKTNASGLAVLIARVQPGEWIALAGSSSMIRKSGDRFSLGTNAEHVCPGDHAQTR